MLHFEHPTERDDLNQKWRHCVKCGIHYDQYEIDFTSGSVEPTVGETLTGATSGKTATVSEVSLQVGTYAGGNAIGTVVVTAQTGDFTELETINGSTGGTNIMTCRTSLTRGYGNLYPEGMLVTWEGREFCREHFGAIARSTIKAESIPGITED